MSRKSWSYLKLKRKFWKKHSGNMICYWCHTSVNRWVHSKSHVRATIDHVIPKCVGGTDDFSNLVVSCYKCNNEKSKSDQRLKMRLKNEKTNKNV